MATELGRTERWVSTASSKNCCGNTHSPRDSKSKLGQHSQSHLADNSAHHIGPTELSRKSPRACGKAGSNGSLRRQSAV